MTKAAYERISDDQEETGLGVERQRQDTERLADLRGWVVEHYTDNDLSAFKKTVVRPRFEEMLLDLTAGKVDGVVVYDLDRLARQPRDLERLIDIFEDHPTYTFASVQGDINLSTPDGQTMARVMVAFANKASKDTGRRVARKHLELADTGQNPGGVRPFGWADDRVSKHPEEAPAVERVAREVVAGRGVHALARELNEEGFTSSTGKPWTHQTLPQYLRNPRLAGYRTRHREIHRDADGRPVMGVWEPLLSVEEWEAVVQTLSKPERRSRVPRRGAHSYLLSGLLRCGTCAGPMYGNRRRESYFYSCQGNGHGNAISGPGTDALVTKLLLDKLKDRELEGGSTPAPWEGEAELAAVTEQLAETVAAFAARELPGSVAFPLIRRLEEEQAEMQKGRAEWLIETTGPAIRRLTAEEWDELALDEQRARVERVYEAVVIHPATPPRRNRIDRRRVVPVPR